MESSAGSGGDVEDGCVDDDAGDSGGLTDCSCFFTRLPATETLPLKSWQF